MDQDKSFYCVIDGTVQVFAQTGHPSVSGVNSSWDDEDLNGYQLLNEVGAGGTVSSLFTILSLFTEDVKMSWQDDVEDDPPSDVEDLGGSQSVDHGSNSDVPAFNLEHHARPSSRRMSSSSASSTVLGATTSPLSRGRAGFTSTQRTATSPLPQNNPQIHQGVVARASEDSTLAVIPAEAFRRLTKKYPKATGHIVQGNSSITFCPL